MSKKADATINVDLDSKCKGCGTAGAYQNGYCLTCNAEYLKSGPILDIQPCRYSVNGDGIVTVGWRYNDGPEVTVKGAARPDGRFTTSANAIVPHVAKMGGLNDHAAEEMFLARLTVSTDGLKIAMQCGVHVTESAKGARLTMPPVVFEREEPGQAVMWPDMKNAVNKFMAELKRHCEKCVAKMQV